MKNAHLVSKGQAFLHQEQNDLQPRKQKADWANREKQESLLSLTSAFVIVGHFASDEERLVLSKPVVQFSFTYGALRYFYICLYINHQFLYLL